jgi:hypothetical protein
MTMVLFHSYGMTLPMGWNNIWLKCIFWPRQLDNNLAKFHAFEMDGAMHGSGLIVNT